MTPTCPLHGRTLSALTYTHPNVWRYEYGCGCYRMRRTHPHTPAKAGKEN